MTGSSAGQSKCTTRPAATAGWTTPGGGVAKKSRPPGERRSMAFASSPRGGCFYVPARDACDDGGWLQRPPRARFGCRASGGWERRVGRARCVAYRCCAPRCGLGWQLANCCCAFQPHREPMTMSTGAPTKAPRGACQRVKRDVGRGQQESRRRARPRRSCGRGACLTSWIDNRRACGSHVNMDATQLVA